MYLITPESIELAVSEDINTLVEFDNKGLLLGPDESLEDYVRRLDSLKRNIEALAQELDENGQVELLNTHFSRDDVIPPDVFRSAQSVTRNLYDFEIDWVPGFFANYRMGILFAGCAMYSHDDFFAVFIVRKAFKAKEKWMIYSRTELMAHELCHIAHIGFHTKDYEEIFAYQTSVSVFRKIFGGMLRTTTDTYLILACVVCLLLAQVINVVTRPPAQWREFPMPLIYSISMVGICFVFFRYVFCWRRFRKAKTNLGRVFSEPTGSAVLFRCDESEIKEISKLKRETDLRAWLSKKLYASTRWRIIVKKFAPWRQKLPSQN